MAINLDRIGKIVERYMYDQVQIGRRPVDSAMTLNDTTLAITYTEATIYRGKAMVAAMGSPAGSNLGGNVPVARLTYEVAVPLGSELIEPNDTVIVTVARDPQLVGRRLRITGTIPTTMVTHRRLAAVLDTNAQ